MAMAHVYHEQQSATGTIELREPATGTMDHDHLVSPSRWSLVPQDQSRIKAVSDSCLSAARGNWFVFWNRHRDTLASVSTIMEEPLIRSSSCGECPRYGASSPRRHLSFADQYGQCLEILHYGFNTTVRLHQQRDYEGSSHNGQLFAVKVFRRNIWGMRSFAGKTSPSFSAAVIAALHPHHPNIIRITNLLFNKQSQLCLVTPYCGGGNLHELLMSKRPALLPATEVDCLMVQILRALAFIHEQNMAHGDMRLEAVLLTENGAVKLAGFGDEYVHRIWARCIAASTMSESESESDAESEGDEQEEEAQDYYHHSSSLPPASAWSFSSILPTFNRPRPSPLRATHPKIITPTASFPGIRLPYMAPEEFRCALHRWYHDAVVELPGAAEAAAPANRKSDIASRVEDTRPADLWATGVIYFTLLTGRLPWVSARRAPQDPKYAAYLRCRAGGDAGGNNARGDDDGYAPIEALGERRRKAVYALLEPVPEKRITAVGMLQSQWRENVVLCEAGERGL